MVTGVRVSIPSCSRSSQCIKASLSIYKQSFYIQFIILPIKNIKVSSCTKKLFFFFNLLMSPLLRKQCKNESKSFSFYFFLLRQSHSWKMKHPRLHQWLQKNSRKKSLQIYICTIQKTNSSLHINITFGLPTCGIKIPEVFIKGTWDSGCEDMGINITWKKII